MGKSDSVERTSAPTTSTHPVEQRAEAFQKRVAFGQRAWSVVYHVSAIGAAIVAAVTTLLVAVDAGVWWEGIAAGVATVLSGIIATGRPQEKWRRNRLSRSEVDILISEIKESSNPNFEAISRRLNEIVREHDRGIVGDAVVK